MPKRTTDDAAFEEMLEAWRVEYRSNRMAPRYLDTEHRMWMRFAWDAGRKHGLGEAKHGR